MPNAEGRGIFGFPKEGSGIGANAATAVYAYKAAVSSALLNDPCDNFTAAPWVVSGGGSTIPTITASGHTGNGILTKNDALANYGIAAYTIPAASESATIVVSCWWRADNFPNGTKVFELFSDTNTTMHCQVAVDADGSLDFMASGIYHGGTAAGAIVANTWYYIEARVKLGDGTTGSWELQLNGTPVASNLADDTKNAGTKTTFDTVRLATHTLGTIQAIYDDVLIKTGPSAGFGAAPPAAAAGFYPATYVFQYCNGAWVPVWSKIVNGPTAAPVATYVSSGTSVTISWVEPSPAFSGTWIVKRSDGTVVTTVSTVTPGTTINVSDDSPLLGTNAYTVTKQIGSTLSTPATSNSLTLNFTPAAAPTATTDPGVNGQLARVIHLSWVDGPSGNPDSWKILDYSSGGVVATVAGNLNTVDINVQAGYSYRYTVVPVLAGKDGTAVSMTGSISTKANPPENVQVFQTGPASGGAFPYDTVWTPPSQGGCISIEFQRSWDGGTTWLGQGTRGCATTPFSDVQSTTHTTVCRRIRTTNGNNPSDWVIAYPCPLNLS